MPAKTPTELQMHIAKTYFGLRMGLIGIAVILPVVLPVWGWARGIAYQCSLSAYYHAVGPNGESVRDGFVGLLFVVGGLLCLYKGYSHWEDWLLNVAGVLVVGVALFPMNWPDGCHAQSNDIVEAAKASASLHGTLAVGFFLCIAAVCIFCARKTLVEVTNQTHRRRYANAYRVLGIIMVAAPLLAWLASIVFFEEHAIVVVETFGVLAFGAYWLVKTLELERSHAEQNSLTGELDLPVAPATCDTAVQSPVHERAPV
jgi:hypothetical protein